MAWSPRRVVSGDHAAELLRAGKSPIPKTFVIEGELVADDPCTRTPRPGAGLRDAPLGFGGGGPGACCRPLASMRLLVRVVLIVFVRPICLLLLGCMMAHCAAGRCAEKRMMASDVPHDGPSGRPCQTSRLCTRRNAQTDANRGDDQEFSHGSSLFQSCSGSSTE